MAFKLEKRGYLTAVIAAVLGALVGLLLMSIARLWGASVLVPIGASLAPVLPAAATWIVLKRRRIPGFVGTALVVYFFVLIQAFDPVLPLPILLRLPIAAALGAVLGRFLGSSFGSTVRSHDGRRAQISALVAVAVTTGLLGWGLVWLHQMITQGWDEERARDLELGAGAVCRARADDGCAQEAADVAGIQVAWLDGADGLEPAWFTAREAEADSDAFASQLFVAPKGAPVTVRLVSRRLRATESADDLQGDEQRRIDGVTYHLWVQPESMWEAGGITWQIGDVIYDLSMDGEMFGAEVSADDLWALLDRVAYAEPVPEQADGRGAD